MSKQLNQEQRYQLYRMNNMGLKQIEMAEILSVSPSTVSRELRRNTGKRGTYIKEAHQLARQRRYIAQPRISDSDWKIVKQYLELDFSPEQISNWLKRWNILNVSTQWIYHYIQTNKRKGRSLSTHLRCKKKNRKIYGSKWRSQSISDRISITERPEYVNNRERYGDWEVDTMIGRQGGKVLVTLVERKSKLSLIGLSKDKTSQAVKETLLELLGSISHQVHILTYDNGSEFAKHKEIDEAFNCQAYFARPYCSGDRGLSENTNGLIRQYLPKGISFDSLPKKMTIWIMNRLNNRPRKTLNYQTPNEVFWGKPKIAFGS